MGCHVPGHLPAFDWLDRSMRYPGSRWRWGGLEDEVLSRLVAKAHRLPRYLNRLTHSVHYLGVIWNQRLRCSWEP